MKYTADPTLHRPHTPPSLGFSEIAPYTVNPVERALFMEKEL
ncbi:MAG: hypothetical protein ACRD1P_12695 [Thermoanaerobaculia bacterium]